MIIHVKSIEKFNSLLNKGKVLIDFFAEWCGPCKMLTPNLEDYCKEHSELTVLKVDVDALPDLARQYSIYSIPSLFLYQDGKLLKNQLGYMNKIQLENFLS